MRVFLLRFSKPSFHSCAACDVSDLPSDLSSLFSIRIRRFIFIQCHLTSHISHRLSVLSCPSSSSRPSRSTLRPHRFLLSEGALSVSLLLPLLVSPTANNNERQTNKHHRVPQQERGPVSYTHLTLPTILRV